MLTFLAKTRRNTRRTPAPQRRFESLEARLYMWAPMIQSFSASTGTGHNVTLSGYVSDENPASNIVTFDGVVTGSTTPDAAGYFEYLGVASSLGSVRAVAFDGTFTSFPVYANVTTRAPAIGLTVTEIGASRWVTLSGTVNDESPAGLTVVFSGQVSGSAVTDQNGAFTLTTQAAGLGTVNAETTDVWGYKSYPCSTDVQSNAPLITLVAIESSLNYWTFEGTVGDEFPEGLTVVFGGILAGYSTVVQADGTYSLTVQLDPGEEGLVTAFTTDWWGLESNVAEDWVDQTS